MSANRVCSHIYFCEELIVNILKRLPVKSLLRFMTVCKFWLSLIKSPDFISSHFDHHANDGPKYLMYCLNNDEYRVYEDNDNLDWHFEFRKPGIRYSIVGCCNGIICLGSYRDNPIVLWNSSLRKSFEIPVPHCTVTSVSDDGEDEDMEKEKFFYWFGFDVASNDYKVMWVRYSTDDDLETSSLGVYIYSLKERTWRSVESSFVFFDGEGYTIGDRGEYINGVIHWVARTCQVEREMPELILTFNLADETFNSFNVPSEIEYVEQIFGIMDFEEFLKTPILFDNVDLQIVKRGSKNCLVVLHEDLTSMSLWVLEHNGIEGFWSLEFCSAKGCLKKILNVRANGKIVVQLECGIVISSDYNGGGLEVVSSEEIDYVGNYMESLILL